MVVGVGLPQVNLHQEVLRAHFERTLGDGFLYAYMLPGMQKVTQAVGRVIRTETDTGSRCCWMTGTAIRRIGG